MAAMRKLKLSEELTGLSPLAAMPKGCQAVRWLAGSRRFDKLQMS
jgi:hypothetical protein